jgi:hypothetical protein
MPSPADSKKKKLEFSYDSDGRRISKKVFAWNSQSLNWELSIQRHFVHAAGFNLLAELNPDQSLMTSFVCLMSRPVSFSALSMPAAAIMLA